MRNFDVVMTTRARNDLRDIAEYLTGFSFVTAENYYRLIMQAVNDLEAFPKAYPHVRDETLRKKGFRWTNVRNYTIYFIIHEKQKQVIVERILYSRREYDALL